MVFNQLGLLYCNNVMRNILIVFLLFFPFSGFAVKHKFIKAEVNYIFDGDTFSAKVFLNKDIKISVRVRILDIDTPEISGQCQNEIGKANLAKERLKELLPIGSFVKLSNIKDDKYLGRIDAYVINSKGQNVSDIMIKEGFARKYKGKKRLPWCTQQEMKEFNLNEIKDLKKE